MSANNPNQASEKQSGLINKIKTLLNEQLSDLMTRMFNNADDILFNLAENVDSNEDQNHYFDTMRLLRVERSAIQQAFSSAIQDMLTPNTPQHGAADQPFDENELSLVDQDEMEEMVATSTMASRAVSQFGEAINHLEARLEFLAIKTSQDPGLKELGFKALDKQALDPKHICEAFQQSLKPLELNSNNKLIMNKLFEQQVLLLMADTYQAINQLLIDADILPQIQAVHRHPVSRPSTISQPTEQARTDSHSPAGDYEQGSGSSYSNALGNDIDSGIQPNTDTARTGYAGQGATASQSQSQDEIHRVIDRFLSGGATASGPGIPASFAASPTSGVTGNTQYYDRRDVVTALSNLQNRFRQQQGQELKAADFKREIMADMGTRHGGAVTKQVNQVDEKTIDFIEMLFDAINEDGSISDVVTNLLLRMQIPVIKAAMLDQDFFTSGDHPARHALNLIAQLGKGINQKDDPLFMELEAVVDDILSQFDADVVSFQQAVDQLNNLIHNEQQKTEAAEKHTQKTVLQEHARQVVLEELQYHMQHHQLPKALHPLVLKHWSTLMFHRYIREGKNSDSWNQAVSNLRHLLACLQPPDHQQHWHALKHRQAELVNIFRQELYGTRQDPSEIDTAISHLAQAFENVLEQNYFADSFDDDEEVQLIDLNDTASFDSLPGISAEPPAPTPMEQAAELSRGKITHLPQDVRPGVWFEIYNGEDSPVRRLKLSVIIMEDAELIFIDRMGKKVLTKDAAEFADELAQDKSRFIADHSAFDHALSHVINSLATAS